MIVVIVDLITRIIEIMGYFGVLIPMVLDTCFVPTMSLIAIPLAGFLVSEGIFNFHLVALVGAIGNTLGAFFMHYLGTKIPERKLISLIEKYGKYILLEKEDYKKAKNFLTKGSVFKVYLGRFLPAVRNVMSLPAGVVGLNRYSFLLASFLGSLMWCYILVFFGNKLGDNWILVKEYISKYEEYIYGIFLIITAVFVYKRLRVKKARSNH